MSELAEDVRRLAERVEENTELLAELLRRLKVREGGDHRG